MASWLDADFDPDDAAARAQMMSALGENVGAIEIDALTPPAAATEPHHGLATNHSLHSGPPFLRASVPWGAQPCVRSARPSALAAFAEGFEALGARRQLSVHVVATVADMEARLACGALAPRWPLCWGGRPPRCISPSTWAKRPLARSLWPNCIWRPSRHLHPRAAALVNTIDGQLAPPPPPGAPPPRAAALLAPPIHESAPLVALPPRSWELSSSS